MSVVNLDWTTFLAAFADLKHIAIHSKEKCLKFCVFNIVLLYRRKSCGEYQYVICFELFTYFYSPFLIYPEHYAFAVR